MSKSMRLISVLLLTASLGVGLAACQPAKPTGESASVAIAPAAQALRKPGLWEQKISHDTAAEITRICLDAAAENAFAGIGHSANDQCEKHEMTAAADGMWRFLTVCQTEAGRVSTEGSISGDFTTHYQVDAQIQGETGPAERLRVDANLRGDCPAGMKPGDVVMPNGAVHHAADIASANAAAPAP